VRRYRSTGHRRGSCRFDPSCAAYALGALEPRRLSLALAMIASRLVRCNPLVRRAATDPVAHPRPCAPRPNAVRTLVAVVALGGTLVVLTAGGAASDDITGGCTGAVNGRDAATLTRDEPLLVRHGETVSAGGDVPPEFAPQNPQSLTTVEVRILSDLGGITTEEHVSNGPTYSSEAVDADDYLRFGAGLYEVKVVNRGQGWRCEYTGYIELDADPLGTPIGVAGAASVVVGGIGVVLAKGVKRSPSREWIDALVDPHDRAERDAALRAVRADHPDATMFEEAGAAPIGPPCCLAALALPLPAMPLFGAVGGAGATGAPRPGSRRIVWSKVVFKRGHPIWGGLAGLALGLGASVLLWQYAVWLLSLVTVVAVPVVVALVAAFYAWTGRRYRARVVVTDDAAPPGGSGTAVG
jgi:putative component of membrane protein insertase Oxa1/YidC/SpoIIIJ protein YidD